MKPESLARCSQELDPILSQINPVTTLTNYLLKINFNIILQPKTRSPKWSLLLGYRPTFCIYSSSPRTHITCTRYMPRQSDVTRFDYFNNIW